MLKKLEKDTNLPQKGIRPLKKIYITLSKKGLLAGIRLLVCKTPQNLAN